MLSLAFYEGLKAKHNTTEGAKRIFLEVSAAIKNKTIPLEEFSLLRLATYMGVVNPLDIAGTFAEHCDNLNRYGFNSILHGSNPDKYFQESNPGLLSNAFALLATELLSAKVIEGYTSAANMIADTLMPTVKNTRRFSKMAGATSLGSGAEVEDGHPYPETDFSTKWVQTFEKKYGNMLSISELAMQEDQTGLILRQAATVGEMLREAREIEMISKVLDVNSNVYRPAGVATALYSATNQNKIGYGSAATGYTSAIPLTNWQSVDTVNKFRALEVKDDRIDGTPQPIVGLGGPAKMLVPRTLLSTANYIKTATMVKLNPGVTNAMSTEFANPVGGLFEVVSSPYVDAVNTADWYYGQFNKQFVYSEVWPLQTFVQGSGSEAAFERDVGMRVKVRYLGGVSATDTKYVTKVVGA